MLGEVVQYVFESQSKLLVFVVFLGCPLLTNQLPNRVEPL
jgi:hypothetical protein